MKNLFVNNYKYAVRNIKYSIVFAFLSGFFVSQFNEAIFLGVKVNSFADLNAGFILRSIEGGVEGVIYLAVIVIITNAMRQWRATLKLLGVPPLYILKQNYLISKKSKKFGKVKMSFWEVIGMGILFLLLYLISDFRAIIVGCVTIITYSILPYLCFALPTTILFLGVSNERNIALQAMIRDQLGQRLRVVSLLDVENYYRPFTGYRSVIGSDCLRTEDNNWKEVFKYYAKIVPIIVVDGREYSKIVKEELHHILSKEYEHKTIFITELSGKTEFENSANIDTKVWDNTRLKKVPERTMFALIFELTRSTNDLPRYNYGVKEILKKYSNYVIV